MNLQKAIKIIKERGFCSVEKIPNKAKNEERWQVDNFTYTDHELIAYARGYTSDINRSYKKHVKHFNSRKERTAERSALAHEDYDKIPLNSQINPVVL
jgi:hypothetical protein